MRLMWETSHPLSFAVAGYALAASIMPNLVLIAAGHLVGTIPAAAAAGGLGSAAGHRLVLALAITGALYAAGGWPGQARSRPIRAGKTFRGAVDLLIIGPPGRRVTGGAGWR